MNITILINFKYYIENREEIHGTSPEGREAMREIQITVDKALDNTIKTRGNGIDSIKFELISEERAKEGIQLNMEAKGTATAPNKQYIIKKLQNLMAKAREPLWQKKIFLEVHYHQVDVQENTYEVTDVTHKLYFTAICAAIIFK